MNAISEQERREAGEALRGLAENHPVRRAIRTVLADVTAEIEDAVGNETIGGDHKLQIAGQLGGVLLVRSAFLAFEHNAEAAE